MAVTHDPDHRIKGRARGVTVAAMMLLITALQLFGMMGPELEGDRLRLVEIVRAVAFGLLVLVLIMRSTTGLAPKDRSPEMNDELTRANRAEAARWGLWTTVLTALVLLGTSYVWPMRAQDVLPIVLMLGAFVASIRFVRLETKDDAGGG